MQEDNYVYTRSPYLESVKAIIPLPWKYLYTYRCKILLSVETYLTIIDYLNFKLFVIFVTDRK
jgi:hypothetical protein